MHLSGKKTTNKIGYSLIHEKGSENHINMNVCPYNPLYLTRVRLYLLHELDCTCLLGRPELPYLTQVSLVLPHISLVTNILTTTSVTSFSLFKCFQMDYIFA